RKKVDLFTGSSGIPLGVVPKFNFATETISLQKGDYIILISDGVIEAKSESGEMYSLGRLTSLLTTPAGSAQELLDFILKDLQKFSGKGVQHDDLTIVVIKWG
ncbi:MAG: PP2C family protein-serine/threonine phosphatase, partial [Calditrichia bacterium]